MKRKKAILKQYIGLEKRIARLLDEKEVEGKSRGNIPRYTQICRKREGCDKIQNAVCQIVDLEQDINREIDAQIDLLRRIEAAVNRWMMRS